MHDSASVELLLNSMAQQLVEYIASQEYPSVEFVGIRTGGVWVARAIQQILNNTQALGELDISFYRDDFTQIGLNPKVTPSSLPFETKDKHIILFDDVLMSGRTVRAAMNEIFDYGRPASIALVVLVNLGKPELPIAPDVIGTNISLKQGQRIKLLGPDELRLTIKESQA
ncbi:MAG: bifunctional pyr operon transcriptional regulator/uracil phosphoribosyltransferase PyrR [Oleiphilus sp.]